MRLIFSVKLLKGVDSGIVIDTLFSITLSNIATHLYQQQGEVCN